MRLRPFSSKSFPIHHSSHHLMLYHVDTERLNKQHKKYAQGIFILLKQFLICCKSNKNKNARTIYQHKFYLNQDSSVSIVTTLRAGQPKNMDSILGRSRHLSSSTKLPARLWGPTQPHTQWVPKDRSLGWSGRSLKLTTHLLPLLLAYYIATSLMLDQGRSHQLKILRCDYVLPGQGYRTCQGSMIAECGTMVDWWLAGGNVRNLLHLIHYEFEMKPLGTEPETLRWIEAGV
jgi:hypothetical protein